MLKLAFSSLFTDPTFSSLKHALLYFDELAISEESFMMAFGEKYQSTRYLQLVPKAVREHLAPLEAEGLVKFTRATYSHEELTGHALADAVLAEGIPELPIPVSKEDLFDLCVFMNLRPDYEDAVNFASQIALVTATICLRDAMALGRTPCCDNEVVKRWVEIGCRALGDKLSGVSAAQKHADLALLSMRLTLPAFEFATFEDMLEARWRLRAELEALRSAFGALAVEADEEVGTAAYKAQVERIVETRVLREIQELEKASTFSATNVAKRMSGAAVLVALQSILPTPVREWILGLSLLSLPDAAKKEAERANAALSASPFSMLVKLRRAGAV